MLTFLITSQSEIRKGSVLQKLTRNSFPVFIWRKEGPKIQGPNLSQRIESVLNFLIVDAVSFKC